MSFSIRVFNKLILSTEKLSGKSFTRLLEMIISY